MKYFIVGLHSSGKQEVINQLEKMGVKCGKIFSNLETPTPDIYSSENFEYYDNTDINNIFENNAYIFLQELPHVTFNADKYYEGLSKYTYDENDVFILSPDQLIAIPPSHLEGDICFVWMDNTKSNRASRYRIEKRIYNFLERDSYERRDISSFVKTLYSYNAPILYFANEEPNRIATIINTTIKYPETFDDFVKNFN